MPVTLRRDVETLAARGRVQRMHGAVVWTGLQPDGTVQPRDRSAEGITVA
jgi:DeoR/GlpR family transcriptional regulator of sugar metabolism